MNVAVIGLGKIGLPIAVQFAMKNCKVIGVDINENTVQLIQQGMEPFPGEKHLGKYLNKVITKKNLEVSKSHEYAISRANVIVVAVGLFIDHNKIPNYDVLDEVTDLIGRHIKVGSLVCYETTLPIGTTRNRFAKRIEDLSNLRIGEQIFVAYSPERVSSGRIFDDLRKYPKIVGGVTQKCSQYAASFYQKVIDFDERPDLKRPNGVWEMKSAESAEYVKLAETTYRDVNIALANQYAKLAEQNSLDVYEVIEAANSQNFSYIHQPGIAVGGHCIPVYPYFLMQQEPHPTLVEEARVINDGMPSYCVDRLEKELGSLKSLNVVLIGVTYRAGVKETAFSGALNLIEILEHRGAKVEIYDPLYSSEDLIRAGFKPFEDDFSLVDVVIIQSENSQLIHFLEGNLSNLKVVFDGRNCLVNYKFSDNIKILTVGKAP